MNLPPPLSLAQAWEMVLADVTPLTREDLPIAEAIGRYLAAPLLAARTQPAADLSAMDGYAMRAGETVGPWRIVGESAAGHPFAGELAAGESVRISTGALMPSGAGAVLLQENAIRVGDMLSLNGEGEPGARHIRREGFDFRNGDIVLAQGARIGPAQVAVALSAGHAQVPVHRAPSVAILDSGDELASDPAACAPGQIPASNGVMLAAMVRPLASPVVRLGPVPDRLDALVAALQEAGDVDVIVTSGGASVGDHDLVRPALEAWGATVGFWRVAMKPGKPLLIARRGRQVVLGLPGNPVSSYVTAHLFLLPLLRALAGASFDAIMPRAIQAGLDAPLPATGERHEFVRAIFANGTISPLDERDSSALASLARANVLIDCKPNTPARDAGYQVWAYLLENGGIA